MPNEHGTWQFGRMGWCDGQEVGTILLTRLSAFVGFVIDFATHSHPAMMAAPKSASSFLMFNLSLLSGENKIEMMCASGAALGCRHHSRRSAAQHQHDCQQH
jgi:hypothetical protein